MVPQDLYKYLMFRLCVGSLFLMLVVANIGESEPDEDNLQGNDSRINPAYLNPDLYREGIASLVNAKERAEELMYKNDIIAKLVTEMPYHDIQNRLLISGNHKEVNRSFFENLNLKDAKPGNCGRFDVFRLLTMVQRSRERAMLETTVPDCGVDSDVDTNLMAAKNTESDETTTEVISKEESTNATGADQPFDWAQLAEASKHLLEQRAKAASQEDLLTSTEAPLLLNQEASQQLPTLLKFPVIKNQPPGDAISSVLLSRLGETLNLPRQKLLTIKPQVLPDLLLSIKNQLPSQLETNGIKNIQIEQALEAYNRDIDNIRNARNYLLKNRINS